MRKNLVICLLSGFLLAWWGVKASLALADEDIEYRFERLWPQLEQHWYFEDPSDVAVAPDGNVYVLDLGADIYVDALNPRILQFSSQGAFIRSWGSRGSGDGQFTHPRGLAIALDGSVYVADTGNHRIQQFSALGEVIRTWGSEGTGEGQFKGPRDPAIAPDGSVYVVDAGNNRIQQFSAEGAFIRTWGSSGSGEGQLNDPIDLTITPDSNVYVLEAGNRRIQKFNAQGAFIQIWDDFEGGAGFGISFAVGLTTALNGSVYLAYTYFNRIEQFSAQGLLIRKWGNPGTGDGQFNEPVDLAIAPDGSVYVVDARNRRIQKFSTQGEFIQSWGSYGLEVGQFKTPHGLAVGSDGSIYVADTNNHRVQQFSPLGGFIREWGSEGFEEGQLDNLQGIAIGPDDSVYVLDTDYHRIQQFNALGVFIRTWGGYGSEEGKFKSPSSLAIAPDGSVYVADTFNYRIQQFSAQGEFIRTWGSDGFWKEGEGLLSNGPRSLTIAPDGSAYVATESSARIQQFSAKGEFIRKWGDYGSGEGQFKFPSSPIPAATGPDGSVYVIDRGNDRIQQFSAQGTYIQSWGSEGSGEGQFKSPSALAIAPDGSVYVADSFYHRIQKFVPRNKTDINNTAAGETVNHTYKGIILAGGGETIGMRTNHIWDGTWRITQKAYKALSQQAFIIHDEIKFLTAGSTQFDLDRNKKYDDLEAASKDSLRRAITEWATDAKDVVIFLANHGGPGKFQVNGTEILIGDELNDWVNQLDARIPGTVTVVIEACNSASFFKQLSKPKRNLFASAKADQPAVISNGGLSSFSYFFWSEVATGAHLQEAFRTARQAMSTITVAGLAQDAQADTNGDHLFSKQDLDTLGDYCLGNCNQTAAAAPVIKPISPNTRTLYGETAQDFSVTVGHLQTLDRVWALVQRPDDISIDSNQPLNFEKITLSCKDLDKKIAEHQCQGRYSRFDLAGEYRLNFYALDLQGEVSSPESMIIEQTQGKSVFPTQYDDQLSVVYLRDVVVNGQHLQAALELQGDKFVVITYSDAPEHYTPAAQYDPLSGLLTIPHALVFEQEYQATFRHLGNLEFQLESATPK